MFLKSFGMICKPAMIALLGKQDNFKEIKYVTYRDESICEQSKCPIFTEKNKFRKSLKESDPSMTEAVIEQKLKDMTEKCCGNCSRPVKQKEYISYINEQHQYQLKQYNKELTNLEQNEETNVLGRSIWRFSKSQIKQFILYHFLNISNNGIVPNINEKYVAKTIGCNVKTVRKNNEVFVKQGYIVHASSFSGEFTVLINGYKDKGLTAAEGGRGYLTITKEAFDNLLGIKNVNELRMTLRMLLTSGGSLKSSTPDSETNLDYKQLKRMLPKYLSKEKIFALVDKNKQHSVFDVQKNNHMISFKLKDVFDPYHLVKKINQQDLEFFSSYLNKSLKSITPEEMSDILKLSITYGRESVLQVLDMAMSKKYNIQSLGAYIHQTLKSTILHHKISMSQI